MRGVNPAPDFETFVELARTANLVPVYGERLGDLITPVAAALRLFGVLRRPFLLESAEGGEHIGRFSYLGGDPFLEARGEPDGWSLEGRNGDTERLEGDPVDGLSALQARFRTAAVPGTPPFAGGAVGFLGYDSVRWAENIPPPPEPAPEGLAWLGFYDTLLAFDHLRHRILLVANAHVLDPSDRPALRRAYDEAVGRIERLARLLEEPAASALPLDSVDPLGAPDLALRSSMSRDEFTAAVRAAQEYIRVGDAFQIVLSRRIACDVAADPLAIYRALRALNPSPYMFCLDTPGGAVVGSSPEMLVRIENGVVEARPIAGTRRRDPDPEVDLELEHDLLADAKERAEHLMLVDLGRNDIGRVAEYGTVEVPQYMHVERYSHVMHIVSAVRGRLRAGLTPAAALYAGFPAGTVSGAPKIRAMEIINELEGSARGVYAGAVLYSDFAGNLNSCIAIRTILLRDGVASVQAGAGIVVDSVPEREFEETGEKAAAPLRALAWAEAARRVARGER